MTDDSDEPERAVIELDPDDMGTGTVQENGMLYVGRAHADRDVRYVIEYE